jgi:hypothetical protein
VQCVRRRTWCIKVASKGGPCRRCAHSVRNHASRGACVALVEGTGDVAARVWLPCGLQSSRLRGSSSGKPSARAATGLTAVTKCCVGACVTVCTECNARHHSRHESEGRCSAGLDSSCQWSWSQRQSRHGMPHAMTRSVCVAVAWVACAGHHGTQPRLTSGAEAILVKLVNRGQIWTTSVVRWP